MSEDPTHGFASLGEFAHAIFRAASGEIDARLQAAELLVLQACCDFLGIHYAVAFVESFDSRLEMVQPGIAQEAIWFMTIGQSYLYFDARKRFLGTLTDDTMVWEPREDGG